MEYVILFAPLVFWGVLGIFIIFTIVWWFIYEKNI